MLILVGIFSFGFTVLTGVVEEKQSRVVEVVLSTVRARDLLMGKVLGIGILGARPAGRLHRRGARRGGLTTNRFCCPTTTPTAIVLLAIWFVLGYALYSTALGFLGALASRMEEASNASTPVTMVAMVSYFVAIFAVINDPHGPVAHGRHVPAALGTVRRAVAGRVRCDRARRDRPRHRSVTLAGDLGPVRDRRTGLCRGRPADGRPDEAPRRVAVGRGVARGSVERFEQAGQPAGVPEHDPLAVPARRPGPGRPGRPAPSPCRSGRPGSPSVRASSAAASAAAAVGRP